MIYKFARQHNSVVQQQNAYPHMMNNTDFRSFFRRGECWRCGCIWKFPCVICVCVPHIGNLIRILHKFINDSKKKIQCTVIYECAQKLTESRWELDYFTCKGNQRGLSWFLFIKTLKLNFNFIFKYLFINYASKKVLSYKFQKILFLLLIERTEATPLPWNSVFYRS